MNNSVCSIGEVTKVSDKYEVRDDHTLNNLLLSSTSLKAGCSTNGHKHMSQDEVFLFYGYGEIILRYPDEGQGETEEVIKVEPGTVVSVPSGVFHRVHNTSNDNILFYVRVMSK